MLLALLILLNLGLLLMLRLLSRSLSLLLTLLLLFRRSRLLLSLLLLLFRSLRLLLVLLLLFRSLRPLLALLLFFRGLRFLRVLLLLRLRSLRLLLPFWLGLLLLSGLGFFFRLSLPRANGSCDSEKQEHCCRTHCTDSLHTLPRLDLLVRSPRVVRGAPFVLSCQFPPAATPSSRSGLHTGITSQRECERGSGTIQIH